MVGDVPGAVSRHAGLNVVPLVGRPIPRIATRSALAHPMRLGAACTTGVNGVSPFACPAITLESRHDGLPIVHGLVHIEFQIADLAGRVGYIHPSVVKDVFGARIVREGNAVTFRAIVCEGRIELARTPVFGRGGNDAHAAGGGAGAAGVMLCSPAAKGFDGANRLRIRRNGCRPSSRDTGRRRDVDRNVRNARRSARAPGLYMQDVGTGRRGDALVERLALYDCRIAAAIE